MNFYQCRFIKKQDELELINLYHLSKVPLSGQKCGRWERLNWVTNEFHKLHPELSKGGIYKDIDGLTYGY